MLRRIWEIADFMKLPSKAVADSVKSEIFLPIS